MANQFLDTNWVSMTILWILQNSLEVASVFNTEWESEFGKNFPVGSSVQVKLPQRWLVTNGLGYQPQGIARLATTINLDQVFGIHFEWDSYERLVKMERSQDELEENYLKPAAVQLARFKYAQRPFGGEIAALFRGATKSNNIISDVALAHRFDEHR